MRVALVTTFQANKKEPLATLIARIHAAFLEAGLGEPPIEFSFSDAPTLGFVSSVDRVLKRHPALQRFLSTGSTMPGVLPPVRRISNGPISPAAGEAVDFPTLLAIAGGVPKSFPFHDLWFHFQSPAFGVELPVAGPGGAMSPGIVVGDSWWVNGRMRSVTATASVESSAESKKLPALPGQVAIVLAACGKAKKTTQLPLAESQAPDALPKAATALPEIAQAVSAVVVDYRNRMSEVTRSSGAATRSAFGNGCAEGGSRRDDRPEKASAASRVQTPRLRLPRRLRNVHPPTPHRQQPHGRNRPGCRYMEP